KKDLAFIKIDSKDSFPFINLDNISPNLLGETVLVVGNAVGYGSSISRGVLSATKRDISIENMDYKNLVQTDAAINPGNSGGPVIDISGRLVGISSAKMAFTPQGVPTQGLGFAIPADVVRDSVKNFKAFAEKHPGGKNQPAVDETANAERMFGMQLQDLNEELTDALGYEPGQGVLISAVEPSSPADQAGVERGLVIYRVGKHDVNSVKDIENLLGRASIAGFDVFEQSLQARSRLGYMPENVPLYNDMRVTEYLDYRAALKGVPHRRVAERVGDVKELCGLREVERKLIGALSKGYRQRVGLADALVNEPELLILDEPTIGLDPNQIRQVRELIKNLGKQHTILLSTHILPEVEMTCSRVIIIHKGRIEACDTPDNL